MVKNDDGPVFSQPWEAQAFAMVVNLHEKGLFGWAEWASVLGRTIADGSPDQPYYELWMQALEAVIEEKSLLTEGEISERKIQWEEALERTPHGEPIVLGQSDNSGRGRAGTE